MSAYDPKRTLDGPVPEPNPSHCQYASLTVHDALSQAWKHETAGFHHVSRRRGRGRMSARRACAAANQASGKDTTRGRLDARADCTFNSSSRSILPRLTRPWLYRGAEPVLRAAECGLET